MTRNDELGRLERWDLDPPLPPEAHLHPARFASVAAWRRALKAEGYSMPLAMAHGLSVVMERDGLALVEAFAKLHWAGAVSRVDRLLIYDLNAIGRAT